MTAPITAVLAAVVVMTGASATLPAVDPTQGSKGTFSALEFGANPADDGGDDGPAIQAAINACEARGQGVVFVPGGVYGYKSAPLLTGRCSLVGAGRGTVLQALLPMNPSPENQGIRVEANLGPAIGTAAGALEVGQRTITFSSVAGLAIGDSVFLTVGKDPNGTTTEEYLRSFNVIESISGNSVTFRIGVSEAVPDPSTAPGSPRVMTHNLYKPRSFPDGIEVSGFAFDQRASSKEGAGLGVDQTIVISRARNVAVRNISGVNTAGGIEVRDSENVLVDGVYFSRGSRRTHTAAGRLLGGWGSRNVIARNLFCIDVDATAIFFESQMRGVLVENAVLQSGSDAQPDTPVIQVAGGSQGVHLRNVQVFSQVLRPVLLVYDSSSVTTEDVTIYGGTRWFPLAGHRGLLRYEGRSYSQKRRFSKTIKLEPDQTAVVGMPAGIYTEVRLFTNAPVGRVSGLKGAWLYNAHGAGFDFVTQGRLAPDIQLVRRMALGVATPELPNETDGKKFKVQTGASLPAGAFVRIEAEYLLPAGDDGSSALIQDETSYVRTKFLELGSVTIQGARRPPTGGTWKEGDVVFNATPSDGGPVAWRCVSGGSPGEWQAIASFRQAAPQGDSRAADINALRTDLNALLSKLRAAGVVAR